MGKRRKYAPRKKTAFCDRAVAEVPILNGMYFNKTVTELPTYMASQSDCMLHTNALGLPVGPQDAKLEPRVAPNAKPESSTKLMLPFEVVHASVKMPCGATW